MGGKRDYNLGGLSAVPVVGGIVNNLIHSDNLTFGVDVIGLVQRRTAGGRDKATQGVMGVIIPETVVVVLWTDCAATL